MIFWPHSALGFRWAGLHVTLVEHPGRMECGTSLAITEFGPSWAWVLGGLLIVAPIPFTLIVVRPTNKKLLDPASDRSSNEARQLLTRWGRLHAAGTVLSLIAFMFFIVAITG